MLEELRKDMSSRGISTVLRALSVQAIAAPSVAAALAGVLPIGEAARIAAVGTGIAIALGQVISDTAMQNRNAIRSSPASYLLHRQERSPDQALREMMKLRLSDDRIDRRQ
jgi:hypothetical protein